MVKAYKTNPELLNMASELRKAKERKPFCRELARFLEKPTRSMATANISKLDSLCSANENVAVPGKILAAGEITKPINVYAFKFSSQAEAKIKKAGGKCMALNEAIKASKCPRIIC